ncbi:MAG: hypothetical protein ACYC7E_07385 [Armatimonadota bacterium]
MRKQLLVVIGVIIVLLVSNFITYKIASKTSSQTAAPSTSSEGDYFQYDYPLIDVYLDPQYKWTLVIRDLKDVKNGTCRIITGTDDLEYHSEDLSVLTFPAGRGTTPDGCLYLYRDKTLIKDVQFVDDVKISSKSLLEVILSVSYDQVKKRVGGELPPIM